MPLIYKLVADQSSFIKFYIVCPHPWTWCASI